MDITSGPAGPSSGTNLTAPSTSPVILSAPVASDTRPRIGITTSPRRGNDYYIPYKQAVEAVGAQPVDLPPGTSALQVDRLGADSRSTCRREPPRCPSWTASCCPAVGTSTRRS